MSAKRLETIDRIVKRGLDAGGYPGAAVVVGRKGAIVWQKGFGHSRWSSTAPPWYPTETIYDLASLTKVVGTTTAVDDPVRRGKLELDKPVRDYLPEFSGGEKDSVTVRELLEHRSGLPGGTRHLAASRTTPSRRARSCSRRRSSTVPGDGYVYSDLGADVLGFVVEARDRPAARRVPARARVRAARDDDTVFRPADSLCTHRAHLAHRRAATRFAAKCTTRTRSRSAASRGMQGCSARRAISPCSRR